jgi:hypothetical protein
MVKAQIRKEKLPWGTQYTRVNGPSEYKAEVERCDLRRLFHVYCYFDDKIAHSAIDISHREAVSIATEWVTNHRYLKREARFRGDR